jgi:hypothetical protein
LSFLILSKWAFYASRLNIIILIWIQICCSTAQDYEQQIETRDNNTRVTLPMVFRCDGSRAGLPEAESPRVCTLKAPNTWGAVPWFSERFPDWGFRVSVPLQGVDADPESPINHQGAAF